MYSLVEWIDEQKFSVIPLSRIKEPRKDFAEYKEDDVVKASCPGFSGVHNAKLVAIRGNTTNDKKELERLAIENVERRMSSENERNTPNDKLDKRKRKSNDKVPAKKTKTQENKENKEAEKELKQQKKEEQQKKKEAQLKKNEAFLSSLNSFKDMVSTDCFSIRPQAAPTPLPENDQTYFDMDNPNGIPHSNVSSSKQTSTGTTSQMPFNVNSDHNQMMPFNMNSNQNQMMPLNTYSLFNNQSQMQNTYSNQNHVYQNQIPPTPQHYNLYPNQVYNTPGRVNSWPHDEIDLYRGSIEEDACSATPFTMGDCSSNMQKDQQENSVCRQIFSGDENMANKVCQECNKLKKELQNANMRIKHLEEELNISLAGESSYKVQTDGRPQAGVLPSGVASANHMVELMPKSSVYMYPKDLKVAGKKATGCAKARYL